MPGNRRLRFYFLVIIMTVSISLFSPLRVRSQTAPGPSPADATPELASLASSVRQLLSKVDTLTSQVNELRASQQRSELEAEELRAELNRTRAEFATRENTQNASEAPPGEPLLQTVASNSSMGMPQQEPSLEERVSKLEDDQNLMDGKISDESQTKVESGSKYRVRLSRDRAAELAGNARLG